MTGIYGPPQGDITIYNALQYFQSALVGCAYAASLVPIAFILLAFPPRRASRSASYWILLICLVFSITSGILAVIQEAHNLDGGLYVLSSVYKMISIVIFFVPILIDASINIQSIHYLYPDPSRSLGKAFLALSVALKFARIGVTSAFLATVHSGIDGFEPGEFINLRPWNHAAALRLGIYCLQFIDGLCCSSILLYLGYRYGYVHPANHFGKQRWTPSLYSQTAAIVFVASYVIPLGIRIALIATDDRSKYAYNQGTIVTLTTSSLQYSNLFFSLYCAIVATLYSPLRRIESGPLIKSAASTDTSSR